MARTGRARITVSYPAGTVEVLPPGGGAGCSVEWRGPQQAYDDAVSYFLSAQSALATSARLGWRLEHVRAVARQCADLARRLNATAEALLALVDADEPVEPTPGGGA